MFFQHISTLHRARCRLLRPQYFSPQAATVPEDHRVQVESVDDGFIVDEIRVQGSIVAHGSLWMMWKADSAAGISREHLSILELIRPAPELLVVGCGEQHDTLPKETMKWLRSTGTSVEVLPTEKAIQYFNILNQERRSVLAALLPY